MSLLVSVIIPTRNEGKYIARCLESVLGFSLPENISVEILILDGMSEDGTVEVVRKYINHKGYIRLINNPQRIQSCALNLGIKEARGDWILRLDAHSVYPEDYLLNLWETAQRTGAGNVGGVVITKPGGDNYQAQLVQALTTHPFGVGDAGFRTRVSEGPIDTVPFGFFNREVFDKIGYFDERLIRAQDYEFNRRMNRSGLTVWINPGIQVQYYNQPTLERFLKKYFLQEAPYNAYMWYLAPYTFTLRHAITAVFSAGVLVGLIISPFSFIIKLVFGIVMTLYFILGVISAFQQTLRYREPRHLLTLPVSFFLYHFLHGLGILGGIIRLVTGSAPVQRIREPWPGAGRFRALKIQPES